MYCLDTVHIYRLHIGFNNTVFYYSQLWVDIPNIYFKANVGASMGDFFCHIVQVIGYLS